MAKDWKKFVSVQRAAEKKIKKEVANYTGENITDEQACTLYNLIHDAIQTQAAA